MLNFLKHHWSRREIALAKIRGRQALIGTVIGVLLAAGVILSQFSHDQSRVLELRQTAERAAQQPDHAPVMPANTANIGGPFSLTNQDGKTVSDADFRGKYLLVYFGYTYCPDMCPTGLQGIAHALDELGADATKVQPLFITIDPARDTPAKLKEYAANFHPQIIALTGSAEQIAAVAKAYQAYYAKGEKVDENEYMMDHSTLIYLMGPDGKFITTFDEEADPMLMVKALRDQWAVKK